MYPDGPPHALNPYSVNDQVSASSQKTLSAKVLISDSLTSKS